MKNKTTTNFLLALLLATSLSSCKVGRFVYYNFADITDHKVFPARQLDKSEKPFYFDTVAIQKGPKEITLKGKNIPFEDFLEKTETVSFLIIRNDTLLYENYSNIEILPLLRQQVERLSVGVSVSSLLFSHDRNIISHKTNYVLVVSHHKTKRSLFLPHLRHC